HYLYFLYFFFKHTATTQIYTLSLHDALPIFAQPARQEMRQYQLECAAGQVQHLLRVDRLQAVDDRLAALFESAGRAAACHGGYRDRKSTRLNSSHRTISYAVFCLKKKKKTET